MSRIWTLCAMLATLAFPAATALAQNTPKTYVLHEDVRVGDKYEGSLEVTSTYKGTTTQGGAVTNQDSQDKQVMKLNVTVLSEKDGSATEAKAEVSKDSYDTTQDGTDPEVKTPCSLAGKTIDLRRRVDETITSDAKDDVDPTDLQNVEGWIIPDEDYFPDKPVAIGNQWDSSEKVGRHAELGKNDKILCQSRLDWVKETDGKLMGQITSVSGIIRHEAGDVEDDMEITSTMLVDMAAGQIIKADQVGTTRQFTPKDADVKVDIKGTFTFHGESKTVERGPATQP